jgi:AmmeMemoRadiSam system protein A
MSLLADSEKRALLELARQSLVAAVERREIPAPENLAACENLQHPGGAFVTLRCRARLRGCIGQFASGIPLLEVVAYCAKAAALEDPRFEPVRPDELSDLAVEISVLSPFQEISPDQIQIGLHGLVVSRGWQRGVLLPQVGAEFGWSPVRFLEETCRKAGLEQDAWKDPAARVQAFTAEVFSESDFAPGTPAPGKPRYSISM